MIISSTFSSAYFSATIEMKTDKELLDSIKQREPIVKVAYFNDARIVYSIKKDCN